MRAAGQQPRMFVGMMMILIFAEVLGKSCSAHAIECYGKLQVKEEGVLD